MSDISRCGCAGSSCDCALIAGPGAIVSGLGTVAHPYVISADKGDLNVVDTPTVNLTLTGTGSSTNGYLLAAQTINGVKDLTDVDLSPPPAVGDVLGWDGTNWSPHPPSTATPGAIVVASSGGLQGDGSAQNPMKTQLDPNGGLISGPTGLGAGPTLLQGANGLPMHPWSSAFRSTNASINPGSGGVTAEYARWGQLCYLRFFWVGSPGFQGGKGFWQWTAPFLPAGPAWCAIPGIIRDTTASIRSITAMLLSTGEIRALVMARESTTAENYMQDANTAGAIGSGYPTIPNGWTFGGDSTSVVGFDGWYRIADGH